MSLCRLRQPLAWIEVSESDGVKNALRCTAIAWRNTMRQSVAFRERGSFPNESLCMQVYFRMLATLNLKASFTSSPL